jgi:hypothetical protein
MADFATQSVDKSYDPEHRLGANYRSSCRARSTADFISKMGIVEEELDECLYWLELLAETKTIEGNRLKNLEKEANELLSIAVSSIKTPRLNSRSRSVKVEKK